METKNDQLLSELQLCNPFLAFKFRRKDADIDRQNNSLKNEKAKTKDIEKCHFEIQNKNMVNRLANFVEILVVNFFASKEQIKKHYHKLNLKQADAGRVEDFLKRLEDFFLIAARKIIYTFD